MWTCQAVQTSRCCCLMIGILVYSDLILLLEPALPGSPLSGTSLSNASAIHDHKNTQHVRSHDMRTRRCIAQEQKWGHCLSACDSLTKFWRKLGRWSWTC